MMDCMPPCPGKGMNITISIDLGDFLGGPADYCPTKPSCSLPEMPVDPKEPCDPDKVTYFNKPEGHKEKGFRGALGDITGRHHDHGSFRHEDKEEEFDKDEEKKEAK